MRGVLLVGFTVWGIAGCAADGRCTDIGDPIYVPGQGVIYPGASSRACAALMQPDPPALFAESRAVSGDAFGLGGAFADAGEAALARPRMREAE